MIQITVDSVEVYAKLNYLRDKAFDLIEESWDEVKEEYMEEAGIDKDIVMTVEEVDAIMRKMA